MTVRVSSLYIYPIKSCGGIRVPEIILTPHGPQYDRQFVLINDKGKFLSQRDFQETKMCLIETELRDETLLVRAPNMPEIGVSLEPREGPIVGVTLHSDTCLGLDQGDALAEWFSEVIGSKCRLIGYAEKYPRLRESDFLGRKIHISFADSYPLLIISEESLGDLNSRLAEPLPMNRFRPNIVVSGCKPYAEDQWQEIRVGNVKLQGAKQCVRCAIPTTDQTTGKRSKEPLRTLAKYRKTSEGVVFGRNYLHLNEGIIRERDIVYLEYLQ